MSQLGIVRKQIVLDLKPSLKGSLHSTRCFIDALDLPLRRRIVLLGRARAASPQSTLELASLVHVRNDGKYAVLNNFVEVKTKLSQSSELLVYFGKSAASPARWPLIPARPTGKKKLLI